MHDPGLKDRLCRISAPTLLISGERDSFVLNPNYYKGYAALIPGAQHEIIVGAGHRVEEEEPKKIADRAVAFLTTPKPARTTGRLQS
jgi:pimeloyl-ACP methyl ester carboxylesterase